MGSGEWVGVTGIRPFQGDGNAIERIGFDASPVALAICDPDGAFLVRNAVWRRAETPQAAKSAGLTDWLRAAGASRRGASAVVRALAGGCPLDRGPEVALSGAAGDRRVWQFGASKAVGGDEGQRVLVVSGIDCTKRKREEAAIERLAYRDSLTGLPNRRLFEDRMTQALERLTRAGIGFAVHFLDLDHFKQVNDRLGHAAGDELLRRVARRLIQAVRRSDTVARFGGDEFGIVQTDVKDRADAEALGAQLVASLHEPVALSMARVETGASIGIALALDRDAPPSTATLLEQADDALYAVKESGRGRHRVFTERP